MFRKLDLFPSSGKRLETPTIMGPSERFTLGFCKGPNSVGVSHLLPEDGNRSSFRNIMFFRISDDGQSPKAPGIPNYFPLLCEVL
jgi:hypothetical protein